MWHMYNEPVQAYVAYVAYVLRTGAGIVVDVEGECVDDVAQSLMKVAVGKTLPQGVVKHLQVGAEGVLVHGVNGRQVSQHKEQDGSAAGRRSVAITENFDLLGCLLRLL